jgi:hypothetical protein
MMVACMDHGCTCVPHTFLPVSNKLGLACNDLQWGEASRLRNAKQKKSSKQIVQQRVQTCIVNVYKVQERPGTPPGNCGNSSAMEHHPSGGHNDFREGCLGAPRNFSGTSNNPAQQCVVMVEQELQLAADVQASATESRAWAASKDLTGSRGVCLYGNVLQAPSPCSEQAWK